MDPDKLAKVLAMAESEHQGEALSALRAARIMLSRAGMTFKDLAAGARPQPPAPAPTPEPPRPAPPDRPPPPDELVQGLRRQVYDLEREIAHLKRTLDKTGGELERQKEEAGRWRVLARETAEKLWDLGKALERRHAPAGPAKDRRRAVLDLLQDPGGALLSDGEIARRVGASPHSVALYRRRLAIVGRKLNLLPVTPRGRALLGSGPLQPRRAAPATEQEGPEGGRRRWLGFAAAGLTLAGDSRRAR